MASNSNHFSSLVQRVANASPAQRTETLIEGIAQQMSAASGEVTPQELAGELRNAEQSLVKACQT